MQNNGSNPTVSVLMCAYNHEDYLDEAVAGVLSQTLGSEVELVIAEDCSSDRTREKAERWAQVSPQVRVLAATENLGMHANFMRALEACRGEFIACCEADDVWLDPTKLARQVAQLRQDPGRSLSFHAAIHAPSVDSEDRSVIPGLDSEAEFEPPVFFHVVPTASLLFVRALRDRILELPEEVWRRVNPDILMRILAGMQGRVVYSPRVMALYRKSVSVSWTSMVEASQERRIEWLVSEYRGLEALRAMTPKEGWPVLIEARSRAVRLLLSDEAIPKARRAWAYQQFEALTLGDRLRWRLGYRKGLLLPLSFAKRAVRQLRNTLRLTAAAASTAFARKSG